MAFKLYLIQVGKPHFLPPLTPHLLLTLTHTALLLPKCYWLLLNLECPCAGLMLLLLPANPLLPGAV